MPTQSLIDGYRRFREKNESDREVFDRLAEEEIYLETLARRGPKR